MQIIALYSIVYNSYCKYVIYSAYLLGGKCNEEIDSENEVKNCC